MTRRHEELLKQQEKARADALRKELAAAAQKRSGRPGFAEFQEEEARRAQRIHHHAHLEFERVFLATDGWDVRQLQRVSAADPDPDVDASGPLFDPASVDASAAALMKCAYALPCRAVEAVELGPEEDAPMAASIDESTPSPVAPEPHPHPDRYPLEVTVDVRAVPRRAAAADDEVLSEPSDDDGPR